MKVEHLMTKNVAVCSPQDSLNEAARLMWERDCGCIPIVNVQNKLLGIITDRDICMGALFHGTSLKEIPIGMVMSIDVLTCGPDEQLETAEELMALNQVRRLPIVDNDCRLVGILSLNDIAVGYKQSRIAANELAHTMAIISSHR